MLQLVDTIKELVANVREYQKAVQHSGRVTPSLVRAWYYFPTLHMVGASRFIGYKGMTAERYDQSPEVDGKVTEPHLQAKGWFRQLQESQPQYFYARSLATSLDRQGRVNLRARFHMLEDAYDEEVRGVMKENNSWVR